VRGQFWSSAPCVVTRNSCCISWRVFTLSSATSDVSVVVNLVVSTLLVFLSTVIDVTYGVTLVVVVLRGVVTRDATRSSAIAEGPRDASCQSKSCQMPHNSAETTYTTSPDQIDGMKLEILSEAMCDRLCHSTMTRPSRLPLSQVS